MSQEALPRYEFPSFVPLNPIEPGTNVLVMEPSVGGSQRLATTLLSGSDDEGALFVTTSQMGEEIITLFENCGGTYDTHCMAVIDCTEGSTESEQLNVRAISNPSDLTGIGILYSSLYEKLYTSDIKQVRTGFFSLSPLLLYVEDFRPVYRFLHTLTGRVSTANGLGIFALDPETQDEQTVKTVGQAFDGRIDVRRTDEEYELRSRGLDDQPDGWQPVSLVTRE